MTGQVGLSAQSVGCKPCIPCCSRPRRGRKSQADAVPSQWATRSRLADKFGSIKRSFSDRVIWIEQQPSKLWVRGSNPLGVASQIKYLANIPSAKSSQQSELGRPWEDNMSQPILPANAAQRFHALGNIPGATTTCFQGYADAGQSGGHEKGRGLCPARRSSRWSREQAAAQWRASPSYLQAIRRIIL